MFTTTSGRMLRLGLFLLAAMGCYGANPGGAAAIRDVQVVCPDDGGSFPPRCTKEIRIYNNTGSPIWPVIQASIQLTDALNCAKTSVPGTGGDVWLQRALGDIKKCYAVKNDYYAFVNPAVGIPANSFVTVNLPWWSKTTGPDVYIDWWRAGRIMLFDDKTAQAEIYNKTKAIPVVFASATPKPSCKNVANSRCNQLQIFRVPSGSGIDAHLPIQLNEYTFADVGPVNTAGDQNDPKNGEFRGYNQNYNVSNVDQVYLPVAIEPVRIPADVGYLGTTMSVKDFRTQLTKFVNIDADAGTQDWPTYNNPKKMYPNAGIRVPSAQSVIGFYMDPGTFPDGTSPILLPKDPPTLVQNMLDQWTACTLDKPQGCNAVQAGFYKAVNTVFLDNYKSYITTCPDNKVPAYLKKVTNNPPAPKLTAFLTFIYGWVPFNVACPNKELPVANDRPPASRSVIDYTNQMQYNYQALRNNESQWFNPYTQLIHDPVAKGGLAASSYAFSIDDRVSFLGNSGGSLPGGLILAIGGSKGLVNGVQHAPPLPDLHAWYDFSVGLGAPPKAGPYWTKYGICSDTADTQFPTEDKLFGKVIAIDPAITKINNCRITLQDSANVKYQLNIIKATPPGATFRRPNRSGGPGTRTHRLLGSTPLCSPVQRSAPNGAATPTKSPSRGHLEKSQGSTRSARPRRVRRRRPVELISAICRR